MAGSTNQIQVLALSPDGKALVRDGKIKLTASGGFFQASGSSVVKGSTERDGTFLVDWYTHENLLPKGETNISFEAEVTKEGDKGYGKGDLIVIRR